MARATASDRRLAYRLTVAEYIKAQQSQRGEVVALAESLFDGKRAHEPGRGAKIVPPAFKDLTPHVAR